MPYIYVFGNQWNDAINEPTIEYHVPKLARTDNTVTGADGGAIVHRIEVSFGDD